MNTDTYTIDLSPKAPRLYAKQLPELVEHYLASVTRDNQAKTAYGYRAKLRYALEWWQEAGSESDWMLGADELAKLNDYLDGVIVQSGKPMSYNSRFDVLRRCRRRRPGDTGPRFPPTSPPRCPSRDSSCTAARA